MVQRSLRLPQISDVFDDLVLHCFLNPRAAYPCKSEAKAALLQERRQRRERMRREGSEVFAALFGAHMRSPWNGMLDFASAMLGELRLSEGDFAQAKSCLAQASWWMNPKVWCHRMHPLARRWKSKTTKSMHLLCMGPCPGDVTFFLVWRIGRCLLPAACEEFTAPNELCCFAVLFDDPSLSCAFSTLPHAACEGRSTSAWMLLL